MDDDITDIEDDGPDTEVHGCVELSDEEAFILQAFRDLDERGRQTVWELLKFLYRIRRQGVDDE